MFVASVAAAQNPCDMVLFLASVPAARQTRMHTCDQRLCQPAPLETCEVRRRGFPLLSRKRSDVKAQLGRAPRPILACSSLYRYAVVMREA